LRRMDTWLTAARPHWPPSVPRDFSPLISTLDTLGLDRVYANYWIAYRLDFETQERIVAAELPGVIDGVTFDHGRAIPSPDLPGRYPPYRREVRAVRHGFVFFRNTLRASPIARQLTAHGYRRYPVGPFIVFAPPH
jgi:hypothetical protein